jgi:aldehyde dehydrogenase (NAD+)
VYEEVVDRLGRKFDDLKAGPAMDDHDLGPLISNKQREVVARYLEQGERELKLVGRGSIVEDAPTGGHYVPPSLFADVSGDHQLAQEEVFGPLVVVIPFDSEDDAIKLANGTPYGLVAGAWTKDGGRQMRLARSLRAGQVFLNNYGAAGGVELPFGGVGRSGHGREKGMEALYSFSTLKTVAAYHG